MSWKDLKDRVLGTGEENEPEFGMTMEMPLRELVASQLATLSVRARSDGLDELPLAVRIQLSVDLCMLTLASGLLSGEISVVGSEKDGAGVVLEEISHDSVTLLIQGKAISDRYDRDKVTVKYDLDDHPAIAAAGHLMVPTRGCAIVQLAPPALRPAHRLRRQPHQPAHAAVDGLGRDGLPHPVHRGRQAHVEPVHGGPGPRA